MITMMVKREFEDFVNCGYVTKYLFFGIIPIFIKRIDIREKR